MTAEKREAPTLREQLAKVPESPGVYIWKDAAGDVLYVGKAKAVRRRMRSYLRPEHEPEIRRLFPNARIARIADAGHWLHAEQPQAFLDIVEPFLAGAV